MWPSYLLLRRRLSLQNALLLVASYVFYGWWEWRYVPLLLFSTVIDYAVGRWLGHTDDPRRRRGLLVLSCVANLGLLGFFKYWGFLSSTANGIGAWLGLGHVLPELHVLLPIGISFYTFQSMAYTIDVYRGFFPPWRSFVEFATYISFFPQLVAGPIERPHNLLRAMGRSRRVTWEGIEEGAFLFVTGWLLKAFADVLGGVVDPVYADPSGQSAWTLVWAVYGFCFQVYCDFFGYSQMARGLARFFGFRLMENFRAPFFASDVRRFWARWHVSLTTWLRDYLFRSLGGARRSNARVAFNILVTMLLAGLWHGAAGNYVVWGGALGVALLVHQLLLLPGERRRLRWLATRPVLRALWLSLATLLTFNFFALTMVVFRSQASETHTLWQNALIHYRAILQAPFQTWEAPPPAMWVIGVVVVFDVLQLRAGTSYWSQRWPWVLRGATIALIAVAAIVFNSPRPESFIYFQF